MKKTIGFGVLVLGLLGGCDIIENDARRETAAGAVNPISEANAGNYSTLGQLETDQPKTVLFEFFTGIRCGNCPTAIDLADEITTEAAGQLLLVKHHAGGLAEPRAPKYDYDVRADISLELYEDFQFFGVPFALVDRAPWNSSTLVSPNNFNSILESARQQPLEVKLAGNATLDPNSGVFAVEATLEYQTAGGTEEFLGLYLVEDAVVGPQKDYSQTPEDVENYTHSAVVRGSFNNAYGTRISATAPVTGDQFGLKLQGSLSSFNNTLGAAELTARNFSVVVFVHDNATRRIRQAIKVPVTLVS